MISDDLLLLQLINSGGSISMLAKRGLSYSQIARKMQHQIEIGNLIIENLEIKITEQGKQTLEEGFREINFKGKDNWILPQEHFYRDPIDDYDIVLPKKI